MKYTDNSVVKIKRELASSALILKNLKKERDVLCREIDSLNIAISQFREKFKMLSVELNSSHQHMVSVMKSQRDIIQSEIDSLILEREKEESIYNKTMPKMKINRLIAQDKEKVALKNSQLAAEELEDILRKVDSEMSSLSRISDKRMEHERSVEDLKKKETASLERISSINEEIKKLESDGKKVNKSLLEEREHLRRQIEEARGWTRNMIAMEAKLTPEYLSVYKRLPSRKNNKK